MKVTLVLTDKFYSDLNNWLCEFADDGYGLPFNKFDHDYKESMICNFIKPVIAAFENGSTSVSLNSKYRVTGKEYKDLQLKPEHFNIDYYSPFEKKHVEVKII